MKNTGILRFLPFLALVFLQCSAARQIKLADRNAETVRMWFEEGWNKNQNEKLIERVFCHNWEDGNPLRGNQTEGIEGIRQSVRYYQKAFANAHFTITHLFASGNHVAIRYEVSAIHVGDCRLPQFSAAVK